jgi:hypothetical protein
VAAHRGGSPDGGIAVRVIVGLERTRPQSSRIRVETQDDLTTPLLYKSGEPVGKWRPWRR